MTSTHSLESVKDWNFFIKDYPVPADCLPQIRPLSEGAACVVWNKFISADTRHSHLMLLPGTTWPVQLLSSPVSARWQADWHNESATDFIARLQGIVTWPEEAPVMFTWAATDSFETTWGVFCRCWRSFLFDDEGPFVWSLQQPEAIRFMPSGTAYIGRRFSR